MIKILVVYSRQPVPTASVHAFVANVKVTSPSPGFSLEYARVNVQLRHPSATTNYVVFISVSELGLAQQSQSLSTQSWRVNVCISKPITKTLWIPFEYLHVKKLIYSEGTLQHYLLLLFNICLALINFNNSGLTYIRCAK